jgi:hypothetical protein
MRLKQQSKWVFEKRHIKILLMLISLDLVATLVWFYFFDIPELNPILIGPINKSPINFVITKLLMSLPSIWLLFRFIEKRVSQIGIGILLGSYISVSIFHYFIFIKLITG